MKKNQAEERHGAVRLATLLLAAGASSSCAGIAVCVAGAPTLGGALLLSGSVLLLWGLHRLGRLGADPPAA